MPPKPVVIPTAAGNNIIINPTQRGNPILECVRNVGKEFGEVLCDYQVGRTTGVLYLSLKYHRLHPEYIHTRIERLGNSYNLRILLILCDISEHKEPIRELTKTCLINNITIIVAFSYEDAGHYLSTFKQFEHKPPDLIKERVDKDYNSMLRTALCSIPKINKTDAETLKTTFGSFSGIANATTEQLSALPGFGKVKVKNLKHAFEFPFRGQATATLDTILSSSQQNDQSLSQRPESPPWEDVEMENDNASINVGADRSSHSNKDAVMRQRPESPPWEIEDTEDTISKNDDVLIS